MVVKKNVYSSNLTFKQLEVDVDTVFYRFNEREWLEKDEESGKEVHLGWIYDEIWYEKNHYIETISTENEMLAEALVELTTSTQKQREENDQALVELVEMLGGMV